MSAQISCNSCGSEVSPSDSSCAGCGRHQPKGVGGWLLFFILTLVVFGPVARIVHFKSAYHQNMDLFSRSGHPYLLYGFYGVEQLLGFAICGYGIFAGIQLWKKNPAGIEKAKRFMIASLILGVADLAMGINWVVLLGHKGALSTFISWQTVRPLLNLIGYTLVWYSYLVKSNRVLMTYPPKTSPERHLFDEIAVN
jgi:Protein of unknown function (DUF2569)